MSTAAVISPSFPSSQDASTPSSPLFSCRFSDVSPILNCLLLLHRGERRGDMRRRASDQDKVKLSIRSHGIKFTYDYSPAFGASCMVKSQSFTEYLVDWQQLDGPYHEFDIIVSLPALVRSLSLLSPRMTRSVQEDTVVSFVYRNTGAPFEIALFSHVTLITTTISLNTFEQYTSFTASSAIDPTTSSHDTTTDRDDFEDPSTPHQHGYLPFLMRSVLSVAHLVSILTPPRSSKGSNEKYLTIHCSQVDTAAQRVGHRDAQQSKTTSNHPSTNGASHESQQNAGQPSHPSGTSDGNSLINTNIDNNAVIAHDQQAEDYVPGVSSVFPGELPLIHVTSPDYRFASGFKSLDQLLYADQKYITEYRCMESCAFSYPFLALNQLTSSLRSYRYPSCSIEISHTGVFSLRVLVPFVYRTTNSTRNDQNWVDFMVKPVEDPQQDDEAYYLGTANQEWLEHSERLNASHQESSALVKKLEQKGVKAKRVKLAAYSPED